MSAYELDRYSSSGLSARAKMMVQCEVILRRTKSLVSIDHRESKVRLTCYSTYTYNGRSLLGRRLEYLSDGLQYHLWLQQNSPFNA